MLYYIGRELFRLLFLIFGRLTVIGRRNVPATGGVLLASNHTSYMDPPLAGVACPRPIWFMAKADLFTVPILKSLIPRTHAFPVKRGAVDRQALRRTYELLAAGKIVNIFFEGGRSKDGLLGRPESGIAMIALRAGVPIVPTALINADRLLPRKAKMVCFTRLTVIFGEPLTFPHLVGEKPTREALREVSETIARKVAELLRAHGAPERVPENYPHCYVEDAEKTAKAAV